VQRDVEQEMEKLREADSARSIASIVARFLAYLAASNGAEVRSTEYFAALDGVLRRALREALHHLDAIGVAALLYEASSYAVTRCSREL